MIDGKPETTAQEPENVRVISFEGTVCKSCKAPLSGPRYELKYTRMQIFLAILLLLLGIIPGLIYILIFCRKAYVPYCPNCGARLA